MNEKEAFRTVLIQELERRKIFERKDGFEAFCNAFGYTLAAHHKEIAQRLERAIIEPSYNLMICMPPGHGKSIYASVLFPSYFLGRFPHKSVIMATHTATLSAKWGRDCKRIISDPKYKAIMGTELMKDSKSSERFDLLNGSEYFACGIGGSVTGRRSDLGLIDDPIRGSQDADSLLVRTNLWDWYVSDFCTRTKPSGSKIIIQTRWHEDDLVGRILNSPDAKNWDLLSLPAIAELNDPLGREVGAALWPDYIPLSQLEAYRDAQNRKDIRAWNALFQQKPTADEGSYFRSEWIQTVQDLPKHLNYYGASDYAVSEGRGDYTVHLVAGHDPQTDKIYVVDVWRAQEESNIWINRFIDLCLKYNPEIWAEESGQIMKSLNPFIEKEMIKRRCYTFRQQFTSVNDKTSRARSIQALMASGYVYFLNRDWTDDLLHELLKFPSGRNDDQVDALGLIGRMLSEMVINVDKKVKKDQDEFRSGKVMLPSLEEKIYNNKPNSAGRF